MKIEKVAVLGAGAVGSLCDLGTLPEKRDPAGCDRRR